LLSPGNSGVPRHFVPWNDKNIKEREIHSSVIRAAMLHH